MTKSKFQTRKPRSDAKLLQLPEEKRPLIREWLKEGMQVCLGRLKTELGIAMKPRAVYETLEKWRTQELFAKWYAIARSQADLEAEERGGLTPEQMEEAVDRNFIMLAAQAEDPKLYVQMRYLRIADQKAKRQNRIAEAKLKHGAKALALAERRVALLEKKIEEAKQTTENNSLSAEERAQRIREILGE